MVPLGRILVFEKGEVNQPLWYSDGTEAGTHQLFADTIRSLASAGPYAGFMPNAVELWITDGTSAGTQFIADFSTVAINRGFPPLVGDRGRLWFVVDYIGFGRELWTSDGTFDGTHAPLDIRPGPEGSDPAQITPAWILSSAGMS
jgi:ELWxxDGT repeat protein